MGNIASKTVLITGASSGIGRATALCVAARGYHVLATSRELSRLDSLVETARSDSLSISAHLLDVNDAASVSEVVPRLLSESGGLDALVNNAGYGLWGCLETLTVEEVKDQFETNLFAVLSMSKAVLPHMRERGRGTIVNVGSVAGRIVGPAGGAYASSKFALDGLTRALRMEVAAFGVRVVLIEPGVFRTNFGLNSVVGEATLDPGSPYYMFSQRIRQKSGKSTLWAGDPARVGRTIARVLESRHPRQRYQVGLDARLGNLAARWLPDGILEYLVRRVIGR